MAKIGKVTFSNSHAATADGFTFTDAQADMVETLNLLSQGDPASASLYSIGANNIAGGTANMTLLPSGTSGKVAVPTDLITQDSSGFHITSALGATVTILNGSSVTYDMHAIAGTIDGLGAGQHLTDSFLYAIKMADGTVSWNTVSVTLNGVAANIGVSDNGVQEDVHVVNGNLTDTVTVDAFAASSNATGFTITAAAGDLGSISPATGSGHAGLTYTVSNAAVFATHLGFGEFTQDSFTATTTNGTTQNFTETIEGNIHAPDVTASAASSSIAESQSTALKIAATDHDDNASLTYTITGVPSGSTLSSASDPGGVHLNGTTYTIDAAALGDLTFNAASESEGSVALHVTVTNTEGDGVTTVTKSATAEIDITVHDQAAGFSAGAAISGTAQEGDTLTASATGTEAGWAVAFQWQQDGNNINGATGTTYTVQEGDEGHKIDVVATVTNDDGATATSTSAATSAVLDQAASVSTPVIAGTAQDGQTLSASATGGEAGWAVAFQWQQDGVNIANATGSTYVVQEGDVGHKIDVVATATNDNGATAHATSSATATVTDETPTATSGSVSGNANTVIHGTLTGSDSDNDHTFVIDINPTHGTLTLGNASTGAFSYTPGSNYVGGDSFTFHTLDGGQTSTTATESITVTDTPVVSGDSVWFLSNATSVDIPVSWLLVHATDPGTSRSRSPPAACRSCSTTTRALP